MTIAITISSPLHTSFRLPATHHVRVVALAMMFCSPIAPSIGNIPLLLYPHQDHWPGLCTSVVVMSILGHHTQYQTGGIFPYRYITSSIKNQLKIKKKSLAPSPLVSTCNGSVQAKADKKALQLSQRTREYIFDRSAIIFAKICCTP